jgi:hypothetical protein
LKIRYFQVVSSPAVERVEPGKQADPENSDLHDSAITRDNDVDTIDTEPTATSAEADDIDSVPGSCLQPVSLQMTQESQLDSTEPVYPSLMDCPMSVKTVLSKLTTASWYAVKASYYISFSPVIN